MSAAGDSAHQPDTPPTPALVRPRSAPPGRLYLRFLVACGPRGGPPGRPDPQPAGAVIECGPVKKQRPSEEDVRLFHQAVGPVRRLTPGRQHHERPGPPPVPAQRRLDEQHVLRELLSDGLDPADLETGEELLYVRPGLPRGLLRQLRRGQFSVCGEIDLHGLTVEEARAGLADFLLRARRQGRRCVRVIHGKGNGSPHGQPVLKRKVSHWLRQRDEVLAFCSARPVDGGTGAVYVLLKA